MSFVSLAIVSVWKLILKRAIRITLMEIRKKLMEDVERSKMFLETNKLKNEGIWILIIINEA